MGTIGKIFKGIISVRKHFIMKCELASLKGEHYNGCGLSKATNSTCLIAGTYSIKLQMRIVKKNKSYCETYLYRDFFSDKTIGIVSIMYKGGNELEYKIRNISAFVYNVFVNPEYRGRGMAAGMLNLVGDVLRSKSIYSMWLAVSIDNYSAINAYYKAGFKIVSKKTFVRFLKINIPYYKL